MKKIISKQQIERKENMKQWVVGIVLIGVLLFSVIAGSFMGFGNNSKTKKINYNGFEFVAQEDYWVVEINKIDFIFNYNPSEIDETGESLKDITNYYDKPLYIFSENNNAEKEIYQNLFYYNQLVQRMQKACPEDAKNSQTNFGATESAPASAGESKQDSVGEECEENIPIKTCENNFIIIKESNSSKIYQQENCVFIKGKQEDLVKLSDEFLFKILGIR